MTHGQARQPRGRFRQLGLGERCGGRARRGIGAAVGLALLAAGCGVQAGGAPVAGPRPSTVAGRPTPTSTSTTSTTAPPRPSGISVIGDDGDPVNGVIANALADIQDYWATEMPLVFHKPFQRVTGGFYAASPSGALPPCAQSRADIVGNAYYCYGKNLVAWDQVGLMPRLQRSFGSFTVAVVLAHELGHAVQDRVGFDPQQTVTREMQADCYAGSWARHVQQGESTRFKVDVAGLDEALAGLLSLRDVPGHSASDPSAHGSGFDRVGAFQTGFEAGPARCAMFRDGNPTPLEFPFSAAEKANGGTLPYATIVPLAFQSLEAYWAATYPQVKPGGSWEPLAPPKAFRANDPPTCGGAPATGYSLYYCVPERYIGYDDQTTMPKIYADAGDFAVAALFGTQYGLAVEYRAGDASADEEAATLRGDCYMGSWAKTLLPFAGNTSSLLLSSGDLDEAIAALLVFRGQGDRERQGPGFNRVRAFRAGVLQGTPACTNDLKGR